MEDRCICCGEIIPEGRQICVNCEKEKEIDYDIRNFTKRNDCCNES